MSTTIQVKEDTVQYLKQLRKQYEVDSYDTLLKMLIVKSTQQKKSLFGKGGKMSMKEILMNLRDKHDRY